MTLEITIFLLGTDKERQPEKVVVFQNATTLRGGSDDAIRRELVSKQSCRLVADQFRAVTNCKKAT